VEKFENLQSFKTYERIKDAIDDFAFNAKKYYDKGFLSAGRRARLALDKVSRLKIQWRKEMVREEKEQG